ncbi:MAG: 3'-5' exonuclease [Streptococcaceae bacterium]|jgi:DNA polymerase-3 subunit epsilon|nr:3'-5' exonuclease [Streptococcaceae bacterium]
MTKSTYIVMDFETTGFSPSHNEIIQLSAVKFDGKTELARYDQLIKPRRSTVSSHITRLTGISSQDLQGQPILDEVFDGFVDFISGELIVGHNIGFDMSFLDYELDTRKRHEFFATYDTITAARQKMPFLQNYKLSTIKYFFDMNMKSHDALNDCLITARLYQWLELEGN